MVDLLHSYILQFSLLSTSEVTKITYHKFEGQKIIKILKDDVTNISRSSVP